MKQFLAFLFPYYYPSGGINDLIGDFDTKSEAIDAIKKAIGERNYYDTMKECWEHHDAYIYDQSDQSKVWTKRDINV